MADGSAAVNALIGSETDNATAVRAQQCSPLPVLHGIEAFPAISHTVIMVAELRARVIGALCSARPLIAAAVILLASGDG